MDQFNIIEVLRLQGVALTSLAEDPADIGLKIAALRAAADLMQQSVAIAALTASYAAAFAPKR